MKKIMISIALFFILALNVKAESCSSKEQYLLNFKASNVIYSIDYEINDSVVYIINVYNIVDGLRITLTNRMNNFSQTYNTASVVNDRIKVYRFNNGNQETLYLKVFDDGRCGNNLITSQTINLPKFNNYSQYEVCKSYPEYIYCDPLYSNDLTENGFYNKINSYKASLIKIEDTPTENIEKEETTKVEKEKFVKTKKFLKENWLYILITFGVVATFVILRIIILKKKRVY